MFQPSDNPGFLSTMQREVEGGNCEFLLPKFKFELRPSEFGSCACRGKESNLHSHLGGAFALDWVIQKSCAKLWGVRFTSLTDCHAIRVILTYDGSNPVLLRLQMSFMLCAMDIYHPPGVLMRPDCLSRLGANLCYEKLTRKYLNYLYLQFTQASFANCRNYAA